MEFTDRLKAARQDADLTQAAIGLALGIPQKQYSRYETGANEMPLHYLVKVCQILGVSSDYLLGLPKGLSWPR